jgi:transposase
MIACLLLAVFAAIFPWQIESIDAMCGVIIFTYSMPRPPDPKKIETLRSAGALNRHPEKVRHPRFLENDFFDPHDLIQLKYETIRAVEVEGQEIARAAIDFGLSRPTVYEAKENFRQGGIEGLLGRKRGPKKPRKLTTEVCEYLRKRLAAKPDLKAAELVREIRRRFRITLHPRTVEKALAKKGLQIP